jgi:hypothetical protein
MAQRNTGIPSLTAAALCTPSRANIVTGDMYQQMYERELASNRYIAEVEARRKAEEARRIDYAKYAAPEPIAQDERIRQIYADLNTRYPTMKAAPPVIAQPAKEQVFVQAPRPVVTFNEWNMMGQLPEPAHVEETVPDWEKYVTSVEISIGELVPFESEPVYIHIEPRKGTRTRRTTVTSRSSRQPASAGIQITMPTAIPITLPNKVTR